MKKLIAYLRMLEEHRMKACIYIGSAGPLT